MITATAPPVLRPTLAFDPRLVSVEGHLAIYVLRGVYGLTLPKKVEVHGARREVGIAFDHLGEVALR